MIFGMLWCPKEIAFENSFPSAVSFSPFVLWFFLAWGNLTTQVSYYDQDPCGWLASTELLSRTILMHVINHKEKFLFWNKLTNPWSWVPKICLESLLITLCFIQDFRSCLEKKKIVLFSSVQRQTSDYCELKHNNRMFNNRKKKIPYFICFCCWSWIQALYPKTELNLRESFGWSRK